MENSKRTFLRMQQFLQFFAAISSIFCINFFHPSSFSQTTMVAAVQGFDFFAKRCLKKQPWLCAQPILRYFPRQRLFVCFKIPLTRVSCKKGIKSSFSQISVFHYRQYWEMIKMLNRRYLMNFHHSGSVQINRWRRGHILPVERKKSHFHRGSWRFLKVSWHSALFYDFLRYFRISSDTDAFKRSTLILQSYNIL